MKKFVALMLVVTAMVISGCAKSDTAPPASTTNETAPPAAPAETAPPAETTTPPAEPAPGETK